MDTYSYTCEAGWEGLNCADDIAECLSTPCENSGVCSESTSDASIAVDAYECVCVTGWEGDNCAVNLD